MTPEIIAIVTVGVALAGVGVALAGHVPRRTFTVDTRFAFITLNPGGKHENHAHPLVSQ